MNAATLLQAPDFSLPATGGGTVTLESLHGQKVVLYFYPKDNTPGCTNEASDFRDQYAEFSAVGCAVFGISRDNLTSHENFKHKLGLPFELLSDVDESACEAFGVIKLKNMYGKQARGIERSTFLIDGESRILKEWRGVKVPGHVAEVLECARQAG